MQKYQASKGKEQVNTDNPAFQDITNPTIKELENATVEDLKRGYIQNSIADLEAHNAKIEGKPQYKEIYDFNTSQLKTLKQGNIPSDPWNKEPTKFRLSNQSVLNKAYPFTEAGYKALRKDIRNKSRFERMDKANAEKTKQRFGESRPRLTGGKKWADNMVRKTFTPKAGDEIHARFPGNQYTGSSTMKLTVSGATAKMTKFSGGGMKQKNTTKLRDDLTKAEAYVIRGKSVHKLT